MPYTSQGYMTHADIAETLRDMDMHVNTIEPHDPPAWFEDNVDPLAECPVCATYVWTHESVTAPGAGNIPKDVYACVGHAGVAHELPATHYDMY
jgi:hypothetical protein